MIEIFTSDDCIVCEEQVKILSSMGFPFDVIKLGSKEFQDHELRDYVSIVPYVVVRDIGNKLTYAREGLHEKEELLAAAKSAIPAFNLRKARSE